MIGTQVSHSRFRQVLVSAVAIAFFAACSGAASPSSGGAGGPYGAGGAAGGSPATSSAGGVAGATSGSPAAAGGDAVKIIDFGFTPASLTVKAGTTVTWANTGSATHTVTSDNGSFDSGNLAPSATFSHAFTTAGTFAYHCAIHHSMVGTITVTP